MQVARVEHDSTTFLTVLFNNIVIFNIIIFNVSNRLQEKLEGIEDGTLLSIQGQVSHLILEATDPLNLSVLFHGWQPWI